jgi:hypothetical protein
VREMACLAHAWWQGRGTVTVAIVAIHTLLPSYRALPSYQRIAITTCDHHTNALHHTTAFPSYKCTAITQPHCHRHNVAHELHIEPKAALRAAAELPRCTKGRPAAYAAPRAASSQHLLCRCFGCRLWRQPLAHSFLSLRLRNSLPRRRGRVRACRGALRPSLHSVP